MLKLEFYKIQKGDEDIAKRLKASLDRLYKRKAIGYEFDLTDESTDFEIDRFHNINFVVGFDLDNLLGYANCNESKAAKNIGKISRLNGLNSGPELIDMHGKKVTRQNIIKYPGYLDYTGKGKVLNIGILEVFVRRQRIGSRLMDHIKSEGYELIELEAGSEEQITFYESNQFVDTGIDSQRGQFLVMAWNNPGFLGKQIKKQGFLTSK